MRRACTILAGRGRRDQQRHPRLCGDCNRARLSTEGRLYLCLFASEGWDLRSLLRSGASDEEVAAALAPIWQQRTDRYSELRASLPSSTDTQRRRIEMSYIGG